ncbi:MAG: hypothetical protein NZM02_02515 [Patescibacteria group bacterium]|nr:hypothetical protein [Patescibacteria group bacterium]
MKRRNFPIKGEISTFLTLGLVLIGTFIALTTSFTITRQKKIVYKSKAATVENCIYDSIRECNSECSNNVYLNCLICKNGKYRCPDKIDDSNKKNITPTSTDKNYLNCNNGISIMRQENQTCSDACMLNKMKYISNSQGKGSDGKNYCCCKKTDISNLGDEYDVCYMAYRPNMYGCTNNQSKVVIYINSMRMNNVWNCNSNSDKTRKFFIGKKGEYNDGGCYSNLWYDNITPTTQPGLTSTIVMSDTTEIPTQLPTLTLITQPGVTGAIGVTGITPTLTIIPICIDMNNNSNCRNACNSVSRNARCFGSYCCLPGAVTPTIIRSTQPNEGVETGVPDIKEGRGYAGQPCLSLQIEGKEPYYYCYNNLICSGDDDIGRICVESIITNKKPTPKKTSGFFVMNYGIIYLVNKKNYVINNLNVRIWSGISIEKTINFNTLDENEAVAFEYVCTRSFSNTLTVEVAYTLNNTNYLYSKKIRCGYDNIIILE